LLNDLSAQESNIASYIKQFYVPVQEHFFKQAKHQICTHGSSDILHHHTMHSLQASSCIRPSGFFLRWSV